MNISIASIIWCSLIPVAAAIFGSSMAILFPPKPIVRSYLQHLAAGVVFSVVAVELLPDIIHRQMPWELGFGFSAGVIAMLALRAFSERAEEKAHAVSGDAAHDGGVQKPPSLPLSLLAGVGIDIFLDGLLISISFAAGSKQGMLLTLALAVELLSMGLAVAATLGKRGLQPKRVLLINSLLFLTIAVGAAFGAILIPLLSEMLLDLILAFGLAALLFLVTEELLVEAHKEPESSLATGLFFIGFLAFLILGMNGKG